MADERIGLQLDLGPAAESAKELGAALQATKADATAFGAALASLDDAGLVPLGELEHALERLGPPAAKATAATTDFMAALDKLIADEAQAEAALELLAKQEAEAAAEAKRLILANADLAGGYKAVETAVKKTGDGLDKHTEKAKGATKGTADFGQSTLQTGRIVQDFAQGGLGGVINNLEGFAQAIGLGSGAAGAMTILGVAALMAAPAVKALWREIVDGSNEVPRSIDPLKRLNEELDTHKKRLKELADQGNLTNTELAEYNRLTAESVRLEKESNAEKQRRNEADKARSQQTSAETKLGADFTKISGGENYDKLVQGIGGLGDYNAKKAEYDKLSETFRREKRPPTKEEAARYSALAGDLNAFDFGGAFNAAGMQAANETLVNQARKGDVGAFNQVKAGLPTGGLKDQLDAIDPAKAQARAFNQDQAKKQISDAIGDVVQPLVSAMKDRNAAAKQGVAQGKAIDDQQDEAAKEAAKLGKADAKARDKAVADVRRAARNIVVDKPEMLRKQPLMGPNDSIFDQPGFDPGFDVQPGWDGLDGGGLMDDPGVYRPRSHEERIAANRRRKAGNRGGGGLRSVGVDGGDDDSGEARQALAGAMGDVQAVAAGMNAWQPAFMQLSAAVRQLAGQGRGFNPYRANQPVNMDMGDW